MRIETMHANYLSSTYYPGKDKNGPMTTADGSKKTAEGKSKLLHTVKQENVFQKSAVWSIC